MSATNTITLINLGSLIGPTTAKILAASAVFPTAFVSTCPTMTTLLVSVYFSSEWTSLNTYTDGIRNLWYSYEYGPVHFIVMSSEHNFLEDSEQYNWLVNDMMNVDRTRTPWLIFMGHRPMYTSSDEGSEKYLRTHLREIYEPLLLKFKVNFGSMARV
jgi:hypothetical protein